MDATEATNASALICRFWTVPLNGIGKANPPASGGIVDSPNPLITSTVLLPNPIRIGAAATTAAPTSMIPVEKGINPPPPETPVGPCSPVGPCCPIEPVGPVGPCVPIDPCCPVGP